MSEPGFISHQMYASCGPIDIGLILNARCSPSIGCGGGFQPVRRLTDQTLAQGLINGMCLASCAEFEENPAPVPVNAMTAYSETSACLLHAVSLGGPLQYSKFLRYQLHTWATARAAGDLLLNLGSRHRYFPSELDTAGAVYQIYFISVASPQILPDAKSFASSSSGMS
jgi:hypothetical protein